MSNEHELIERILDNFQQSHRRLEKEVENLYEQNGFSEEDLHSLKNEINGLYKIKFTLEELIAGVLSENYDSKKTRKNLINTGLINTLKREDGEFSELEKFIKDRLN